MKPILKPLIPISLILVLAATSVSFGESYFGGRSSGHISYYLDDSVSQYGYGPHLTTAAQAWNAISPKVQLKESQVSKDADLYMIGNSAIEGLLGVHVPYQRGLLGKLKVVGNQDDWHFSALVLYHNNMQAKGLTYQQRVSNAIHEIGHSLGLAHPSQNLPSVMKQGISDLLPTSFDRFELINKWSQSKTTGLMNEDMASIRLHANYEAFYSVPLADQHADLIVLAKPKADFENRTHVLKRFPDGKLMDFYTKTSVVIQRVIKSQDRTLKAGNPLTVLEPASVITDGDSSSVLTYENYSPMVAGQSYLIFLKRNGNGDYSVMNMALGTIDTAGPSALMKAAGSTENALVNGSANADKSASISPEDQFVTDALSFYKIK